MKIPTVEVLNAMVTQGDSKWVWVQFGKYALRYYVWDDGFIEVCLAKQKTRTSFMVGWVNGFFKNFETFLSDLQTNLADDMTGPKARKVLLEQFRLQKTSKEQLAAMHD